MAKGNATMEFLSFLHSDFLPIDTITKWDLMVAQQAQDPMGKQLSMQK